MTPAPLRPFQHTLLIAGLVCGLSATPAFAGTTISTSISDSITTAIGSISTSLKKSSQSSTKDDKVADGDYKVLAVATAEGQPGMARLTLLAANATDPQDTVDLYLPQKTVAMHDVKAGTVVRAHNRDYGIEFAKADTRQAFFLVLQDAWYQELASHPVTL